MIKFGGRYQFTECRDEEHDKCPRVHDTSDYHWYDCDCSCHEARECAAANDEGAARRREQFHADVKAIFGGPF